MVTSQATAVPVTKVDDRVFSNGAPGPVASRMRVRYWEWLRRPALRQEVDYRAA